MLAFFLFVFFTLTTTKKVNKGSFFERLNIKHYFCKYNFSLNRKFEFFIESFDSTSIATITNRYDIKKKLYMSLVKIGLKIWIKNIPKKPKPNKKNKTKNKKRTPPPKKKPPTKNQKQNKTQRSLRFWETMHRFVKYSKQDV